MANHSLKAAVKRQHCSLRLTVCAVREERERGQETSKTCVAGPRKAATHTGCFLCWCAPSGRCGFVQPQSPSTLSVLATPCGYIISTQIGF